MAEDQSDKTEEPTQKKLSEAEKKGDFPKSQEVTAWVSLLGVGAAILMLSGKLASDLTGLVRPFLSDPHAFTVSGGTILPALGSLMTGVAWALLPVMAVMIAAALAGNIFQHKPVLSAEKIKPDLSKISPISGAKRLLGPQGWANFAKSVAKFVVISGAVVIVLWPQRDVLAAIVGLDAGAVFPLLREKVLQILLIVLVILCVVAIADFIFQKQQFTQRQRMSKQEVRDEHKQMEGDPKVKAKIRQVRMERSRARMMAAVPEASVVIANPTHYAIALKYESGTMLAPKCVAKGVDALALRIRSIAEEHNVPVVENPPLARALYAGVELDEDIPPAHYKAVAEVIGYVMRLGKGSR
jgi:flagellar biosynthetic protein FlhB